ncbi:flagellar hook protein FlgE [Enterobacteriaceae bacterium LUAb1]
MSFNIANSGLNAITQQLGAISNNIANSSTAGYKSMRAEFAALYAGTQPLGVGVSGITQSMGTGGDLTATGRALDLAISGNGFFVTKDASGTVSYTRAGYFGSDADGYLQSGVGGRLQGYPVDANGELQVGTVADLQLSSGGIGAKATTKIDMVANLDNRAEIPAVVPFDKKNKESYNNTYTTQLIDSQGREHTLTQYFVKTDENKWTAYYFIDGEEATPASQPMEFDTMGKLSQPAGSTDFSVAVTGAEPLTFGLNYAGSTQYGSEFSVSKNNPDGYKSGERTGVRIDEDGSVYATFSNGQSLLQGQVVLASFANPEGLLAGNGTTWSATNQSGTALLGVPGAGMNGSVASGKIENSNVDMTGELVGLMTAQRNYQANTKVISTNDQMMSALFQAL